MKWELIVVIPGNNKVTNKETIKARKRPVRLTNKNGIKIGFEITRIERERERERNRHTHTHTS